ncbi:hypothetical protein [Streptomyces sp. CA2R106]|uniref:hypothetical protein n=1 Tax=Streptomyces sp. CA2R106 TaxID=3120153 RepID=UPI00300AEAD6
MRTDRNDQTEASGYSGLERLEGYLLWNAEVAQAHRAAGRFAGHLPWLTTAEREEVERAYVADRLLLSQETLHRIADRAAQLRAEYTGRYLLLKRRCVAAAVVGGSAAAGAAGAAAYLAR